MSSVMDGLDGEELMFAQFESRKQQHDLVYYYQSTRNEAIFQILLEELRPFMDKIHAHYPEISYAEMEESIRVSALHFKYEGIGISFTNRALFYLIQFRNRRISEEFW
ncbi:hypothetical protein [Thiomicrorhabdus cannonii]|uniref:hypothetical protein n=1 Tax=Thiomicrorhabdus cannonii TaxID=2748011 RepID=UPI0015BBF53E|nr:hypothetical protein [Thiomicrorhabdus cannonii]